MGSSLVILNDPPYGSERSYNGLRLALARGKGEGVHVRVFLIADAVSCAKRGQSVPKGYYNVEVMLRGVSHHGGEIGVCGSCMDARGIADAELTDGARRSSIDELAAWTREAERVVTF
jgi:uncharacterized protein involved in oxidation of intracellular sulfur